MLDIFVIIIIGRLALDTPLIDASYYVVLLLRS